VTSVHFLILRSPRSGRLEGCWHALPATHGSRRAAAALLTMRDRGRAGSSPAMTNESFCRRSPDGGQRNPGSGVCGYALLSHDPGFACWSRISLRSMRAMVAMYSAIVQLRIRATQRQRANEEMPTAILKKAKRHHA
jgi:hypothetical protein